MARGVPSAQTTPWLYEFQPTHHQLVVGKVPYDGGTSPHAGTVPRSRVPRPQMKHPGEGSVGTSPPVARTRSCSPSAALPLQGMAPGGSSGRAARQRDVYRRAKIKASAELDGVVLLYGAFHHSIFTPFLPGAPGAVPELSLPSLNLFLLPNSGGGVLVRHPSAPLQRAAHLGTDPLPGSARSCEVQTGSGTPGNPRGTRCRGWKTLGAARGWGAGRSPTTLAPHGKLRLGLLTLRGQARCFFSPGPSDRTRGDGLRLRQGGSGWRLGKFLC